MDDHDLLRVEGKIDLLFKILLDLNVDHIGYPYDFKYLSNYEKEIRTLYNLDIKEIEHNIKFPSKKDVEEAQTKLQTLQKNFKEGNYLAKEKKQVEKEIGELEDKLCRFEDFEKNRKAIEEALKKVNTELYYIKTYMELRKKLGLTEKPEVPFSLDNHLGKIAKVIDTSNKGEDPSSDVKSLGPIKFRKFG